MRIRYIPCRRKAIFRLPRRCNHRANYNKVRFRAYIFMCLFLEKRTKKSSQRIFERMCSAIAYFCILQISGGDILQLIEGRAMLSPTKTKIKPSGFIQTIKGNEYTELASS